MPFSISPSTGSSRKRASSGSASTPAMQAAVPPSVTSTVGRTPMRAEDLAAGRLVAPFPGVALPARGYHAYLPEGRAGDPAATAFRRWLEETGAAKG